MPPQQQRNMPAAHEDLYIELMDGANSPGYFVIETEDEHPDIRLELEPPGKPTRNRLMRAMPEGLLEGIELPDEIDDASDISTEDIDLSNVSIQQLAFDEESTETWIDAVVEHASHAPEGNEDPYYSDSEIRNILNAIPDEYYISAGAYLIELGESSGPVTGFRRE